jgi:hypothetical protein
MITCVFVLPPFLGCEISTFGILHLEAWVGPLKILDLTLLQITVANWSWTVIIHMHCPNSNHTK